MFCTDRKVINRTEVIPDAAATAEAGTGPESAFNWLWLGVGGGAALLLLLPLILACRRRKSPRQPPPPPPPQQQMFNYGVPMSMSSLHSNMSFDPNVPSVLSMYSSRSVDSAHVQFGM